MKSCERMGLRAGSYSSRLEGEFSCIIKIDLRIYHLQ